MALCRCYRGGTCIITNEHVGSVTCAAKNNGAGRNKWAPRRGSRAEGGGGSDLRRAAVRASLQQPPGPSVPPPMSQLMHRSDHQREGQMRNGQASTGGKRPAEDEDLQTGQPLAPALRHDMHE